MIDDKTIEKIKASKCFYCIHRNGDFRILLDKIVVNCGLAKYPVCRTIKKFKCKDYDKVDSLDFWEFGHHFIEGDSNAYC